MENAEKEIKNDATTLSMATLGITVTALSLECHYVECYEAGSLNKGSCLARALGVTKL
jgi:hypothetical protein